MWLSGYDVDGTDEFQSAPPTEVRGDRHTLNRHNNERKVSIRSPHRSEGRLGVSRVDTDHLRFQSAPPTEVRGDGVPVDPGALLETFQSAPPTEVRGDLGQRRCRNPRYDRFNPLPPPK